MSENLQLFTRAAHILRSVAVRVPTDGWGAASCCQDWSAREVAGHASWVLQSVASSTGHAERPERRPEAEVAGADPATTVRESVDACLVALDEPGTLEIVAQTPFGEMTIDEFLGTIWVDSLTHAWDIADATGIGSGIDADSARRAQETLEPISTMMREVGAFGPAVQPAADDALARFIAFAGRTGVQRSHRESPPD